VVAFSSTAALVQPVTEDHGAVRAAIDELDVGGGTAIGDGMEVALAAIPPPTPPAPVTAPGPALPPAGPPPPPPGVVLLLTDGENTEGTAPLDVAQKARAANVPVFTVGMGSRGGPGRGGGIDEPLLREVAAQTGGQYYFAPNGGELNRVYNDLGLALGWEWERREVGGYFAAAALTIFSAGLGLAFLWLHRQP
jgi:Ca-activated chloride channel family protein